MDIKIKLQILLGFIVMLPLSFMLGFFNSIEQPPNAGEKAMLLSGIVLHALLFIPFAIYFIFRKKKKLLLICLYIYLTFILITTIISYYNPKFNSEKWKSSVKLNHEGLPHYYSRGMMVENIINKNKLDNLSSLEVRDLLGEPTNFFKAGKTTYFEYDYRHSKIFDGCSYLTVEIVNGVVSNYYYDGCD